MIITNEETMLRYTLRAVPSGRHNFIQFDPADPTAPGVLLLPDLTENEVRKVYRAKWNYSDAEIEKRLQAARQELEHSGRK